MEGQLGLEPTFKEYLEKLFLIFDEVKRVLKKSGACWVNLGDTYYGGGGGNQYSPENKGFQSKSFKTNPEYEKSAGFDYGYRKKQKEVPDKSLCLIPFRFSIGMVERGWILRNSIIWHKRNCMPASAKDRFTVDFEYLFFFTKGKKYYFETQIEATKAKVIEPRMSEELREVYNAKHKNVGVKRTMSRNMRSVWSINTSPFPEAHFAVFPEKLCETPIKAGCPEFICKKCGKPREKIFSKSGVNFNLRVRDVKRGYIKSGQYKASKKEVEQYHGQNIVTRPITTTGHLSCECGVGFNPGIVLDIFSGSGTACVVAKKLGRNYLGIELNPEYVKMAEKRLAKTEFPLSNYGAK